MPDIKYDYAWCRVCMTRTARIVCDDAIIQNFPNGILDRRARTRNIGLESAVGIPIWAESYDIWLRSADIELHLALNCSISEPHLLPNQSKHSEIQTTSAIL
jgi:hypothetical protein